MKYLIAFLISMVPLIELRGAIPYAAAAGLPPLAACGLTIVGNLLPVPVILLFVRVVLDFMKRKQILPKLVNWIEEKAQKGAKKIERRASVGLYLFVAIPLPGTGAWTGALVAALLGMNRRWAMLSIFAGVVTAGVLVGLISYGVLGILSFLI